MSTTILSQPPDTAQLSDGRHDFNFITGRWLVGNRRLKKRLAGCTDWERFEAVQDGALLLDGLGNMNDLVADGRCIGMALRFFSPQTRLWSIYWVSHSDGLMQPPVVGAFAEDGTGRFEGNDTHEGRPVRVRFTWSGITPRSARWEQAFSEDGGRHWETNWVMEFTRPAYSAA